MFNRYPVGPASTRVFAGFKLDGMDLNKFYTQLGNTFMPGTPYMQAPMGLNAYLPAVLDVGEFASDLDPQHASVLPDEVALIVYANIDIYQTARRLSLRRRMYTHSHRAVFNMEAPGGGGQFPVAPGEPSPRDDRSAWNFFNATVDWQAGATQLLFVTPDAAGAGDPNTLSAHLATQTDSMAAQGADQVLLLATPDYAVVWTHAPTELDVKQFDVSGGGYTSVRRILTAQVVDMPRLEEDMSEGDIIEGVKIAEASMFNFRFQRDSRFHTPDLIKNTRSFSLKVAGAWVAEAYGDNTVQVVISELSDSTYTVEISWLGVTRLSRVGASSRQSADVWPVADDFVYVEPIEGEIWGSVTELEHLRANAAGQP